MTMPVNFVSLASQPAHLSCFAEIIYFAKVSIDNAGTSSTRIIYVRPM